MMPLLVLLNLVLFVLVSTSHIVTTQENQDKLTLLAIGKELGLSWWGLNNSSDYCSWHGIGCSLNGSMVEKLDLSSHGLQGSNLTLISELKALKWLDLSDNNFHGSIPQSFGNLSQLEVLDLSFNKFVSSIPVELGQLKNLRSFNLSNNFLTGSIPNNLQDLQNIEEFQIFINKLNGSLPIWIGNFTKLRILTAYENDLTGKIPDNLGSFSELQILNLHSNQLEGFIPESIFAMKKLKVLVLTQNKLTGTIPVSIGNCVGLSSVRIGNNKLIGTIPKEVGNITSLNYFEADNNNLSGEIVPEFVQCVNITLLNLASNGFTGTIPREFGRLINLQELIVSGNNLSGDIPLSVLSSKNLNKLDLTNNQFNSSIPQGICNNSRLQYLLLSKNSLKGEIPNEIGNCVKLLELQLGSNYLTGNIPPEIGRMRNLQIALNLSHNHLHGSLPNELGRLDKLVCLDLSDNRLSGIIPLPLKGMLSLIEVNFSNNDLTGPIPIFVPFQSSPNSSFLGNNGLCGEPLSSSCANSNGTSFSSYHHRVSYRIILVVIGSCFGIFVSVIIVVILYMMREKQEKAVKEDNKAIDEVKNEKPVISAGNVFDENLKQAVDYDAAVKSTFKESNILNIGTFSTVYKANMPSGLILSVKKLKMMDKTLVYYQSKIMRELEKLSKVNHNNLTPPVGFVIYEDVVLLLHRYFSKGTLAQFLHESSSKKKPDYKPDWPTRLNIAIGVAEGLAFLHYLAIIHLDIASVNVYLDSSFNALLGEVEISKLLDPSKGTASISAVAGSFGYIPPEYAYTMQVTAPGNVYSYGVVLLEILTTRLPVDEEFGEGIDLVKWVHGAPSRSETPEQILDSRLSTVSFAWRKDMLVALKIALLCTETTPAKRPKMKKVVEMLQEIVR